MNFQDELKMKAKTKQEMDDEQQQEFNNRLQEEAVRCFSNIEEDMKHKVSNADYTNIDGKQVVSVIEPIFYGLSKCVKHEFSDDQEEEVYGLLGQNRKEYTVRHHIYSFEYPEGWDLYYGELKEMAQRENINIEPIILYSHWAIRAHELKEEKDYKSYQLSDFPIEGQIRAQNLRATSITTSQLNNTGITAEDFQLCVKATCEIPDQFSSDGFKEAVQSMSDEEGQQKIGVISIDDFNGLDFEGVCADLLSKNGFTNVRITQESADQGIDILAERDGVKFGIQCKSYSSDVGNAAVQQAYAGKDFYKCHVGVVLTNQHFTRSARELAESNGIILWDRDKLIELFRNAGYQVTE